MQTLARTICIKEGLSPNAILPLPGGQVNHVFRVDDAYVLRIGAREDAHRRLRQETALLQRLAGQVPVPRVYAFGQYEGSTYQIQQYVTGQKLHNAWRDLSPAAQESITEQLAAALRVLHRERYPGFGAPGEDSAPNTSWADYRAARLRATIAGIQALGLRLVPGFIELVEEHFAARRDALEGGSPTLVHGDLWMGNILVENERIAAILDFEYAQHAPADYELLTIEAFCLYPNDYAEEENEVYNAADFAPFCRLLRKYYPALFEAPRLRERLDLYHLEATLSSYLSWRKDNLPTIPPERMAAKDFYMARISNFVFEHGVRLF